MCFCLKGASGLPSLAAWFVLNLFVVRPAKIEVLCISSGGLRISFREHTHTHTLTRLESYQDHVLVKILEALVSLFGPSGVGRVVTVSRTGALLVFRLAGYWFVVIDRLMSTS